MQHLNGKTAFITGGTKGIGFGIADAMLREGMKVLITGRTQESVDKAVEELTQVGGDRIIGLVADVRDMDAQQNAVQKIIQKWSQLDVLIANAGVGHFGSIEDLTSEQWQQTIDVNLTGVFNSIKASLDDLKASQGYFMSIASLAGTNFFAKGAAYNASKFGLVGFTQAVMLDLRSYGIKCTTIMPGSVSTHFNGNEPNEKDAWKIQPEDLGQMVVDLLKIHPRTLPSKVEVRPSRTAKM
jgi:NAD(P)-dependent dehydrogenase (short-subunit alcohol dehydrogenase family)